jgi:hypothetical protein
MSTLTQDSGFLKPDTQSKAPGKATPAADPTPADAPPIGYRRVTRRWRVLPDGTRDYAAYHGKTEFTFLLPVSSKVRSAAR